MRVWLSQDLHRHSGNPGDNAQNTYVDMLQPEVAVISRLLLPSQRTGENHEYRNCLFSAATVCESGHLSLRSNRFRLQWPDTILRNSAVL